ncbi:hypothetical protein F0562_007643 [Nyssa sinensis]|uniref:Uncharacterized protein n=1 Tax=Nyssa sinensis TaxID=561372 RepID=A0A5J5A6Y8_9ASTE|nr:hypothetical protein F0562_007643 [Nyssa sinensis]
MINVGALCWKQLRQGGIGRGFRVEKLWQQCLEKKRSSRAAATMLQQQQQRTTAGDRVKGARSSSVLQQRLWIIEQKIGGNPEGSRRNTWR